MLELQCPCRNSSMNYIGHWGQQCSVIAGAASAEELHQLSMMLATAGPPHCWEHLSIAQLGFAAAAAGAICESDRWRFLDTCHGELLQACAKGEGRMDCS